MTSVGPRSSGPQQSVKREKERIHFIPSPCLSLRERNVGGMATTELLVAVLSAACLLAAPARAEDRVAPLGTEVAEYEVVEAPTRKQLYRLHAWNEALTGTPPRMAAHTRLFFRHGGTLEALVILSLESPPRCLWWQAQIKDDSGRVVANTDAEFHPAAFPFLSRPLPPDTYPPFAPIGQVLTRLGLGQHEHMSFHFILMGTSLIKMDLWKDGHETVRVPAGEFHCQRLRMRANAESLFPTLPAFLRPFVRFFLPTHTLWLTTDDPPTFVKSVGQMGPPGSPDVLVQLLGVKEGG